MSNTKKEIRRRLQDVYASPEQYKHCAKCGIEIATTWANWKYKYCEECTYEQIDEFKNNQANRGYDFRGGVKKKVIERAYTHGKRWVKGECEICGFTEALDVHRIVAQKDGGTYTKDNVITLCPNCHALITREKKELKEEIYEGNRIYKLI